MNNQLQAYLEQLYRKNAMNTSPNLQAPMLHDANLQAQIDAGNYQQPRPPVNYQNSYAGKVTPPTSPSPQEMVQNSLRQQRTQMNQRVRAPRVGQTGLYAQLFGNKPSRVSGKAPRPITTLPTTL